MRSKKLVWIKFWNAWPRKSSMATSKKRFNCTPWFRAWLLLCQSRRNYSTKKATLLTNGKLWNFLDKTRAASRWQETESCREFISGLAPFATMFLSKRDATSCLIWTVRVSRPRFWGWCKRSQPWSTKWSITKCLNPQSSKSLPSWWAIWRTSHL